ncbi:MAG: alpha/beta hydrolase [Minwuiales bacterium]|nr:alpha/beta hydrolase [Minwuiales bacterium]
MDWRSLSQDELEANFNPRIAVPDAETYLEDFAHRSEAERAELQPETDIRYGDGPRQMLDLFRAPEPNAPLHIYIHGGYWRALTKEDFSLMAPPLQDAGAAVVIMDYDLCPAVTVDAIVRQTIDCIAFVARRAAAFGADPDRLFLSGHSAGAHLAAMALAHDWTEEGLPADLVKGAVLVSGIYDPEPVLKLPVNEEVRLTPEIVTKVNAMARPPRGDVPILVAVGGDEPPGWIAQSVDYHTVAGPDAEFMTVPGANHFSIAFDMADPDHALHSAMLAQMGLD